MTDSIKVNHKEAHKNLSGQALGSIVADFHSGNVFARVTSASGKPPYHALIQTLSPNILIEIYNLESKEYNLENTNQLYLIADYDYTGLYPVLQTRFDAGTLTATVNEAGGTLNINLHIKASSSAREHTSKLNSTIKLKIQKPTA